MDRRVVIMKNRLLNIFMNGVHVGILEKNKQGALRFAYKQSWLDMPGARPISLSLPLIASPYVGDIVYNFFDNLLPDNLKIRRRIQSKFHISSNHPFDLLASIGGDCVGALQITDDDQINFSSTIEAKRLSENKIASILRGYQTNPLGMTDDYEDFRISIAGAQEKAAFLYHKRKWHIPLGATPTTHIFKLPIGNIAHQQLDLSESCENEWLCSVIAKAFGFSVPDCYIEYFEDVKVLIVERFDRKLSSDKTWMIRLPQEDMCQALGMSSNLKYQSDGGPGVSDIIKFLLGANNPTLDRDTFFRSQVLFWLLCAIDGHAKNFSIFIEPEGRYRLTPLYDIMSAFPLIANHQLQKNKVKMAMALRGKNVHYKWFEGRRSHFLDTAKYCGYSPKKAEQILDEMLSQVDNVIEKVEGVLPHSFPEKIAIPIFDGMRKMRNRLLKDRKVIV